MRVRQAFPRSPRLFPTPYRTLRLVDAKFPEVLQWFADAGREYGVPLPVTAIVDQMLEALIQAGRQDLDHSALLTFLEDLAHHRVSQGVSQGVSHISTDEGA